MNRVSNLIKEVLRTVPRWVTPEIVHETVELFERRFNREFAPEEIREMICNVSQFVDIVKEEKVK